MIRAWVRLQKARTVKGRIEYHTVCGKRFSFNIKDEVTKAFQKLGIEE